MSPVRRPASTCATGISTVEGGQRGGEGGGGIALDDDQVRARGFEQRIERGENAGGEGGERLARAHEVEIVIRLDGESFERVVEHLAVLRGDANFYRKSIRP